MSRLVVEAIHRSSCRTRGVLKIHVTKKWISKVMNTQPISAFQLGPQNRPMLSLRSRPANLLFRRMYGNGHVQQHNNMPDIQFALAAYIIQPAFDKQLPLLGCGPPNRPPANCRCARAPDSLRQQRFAVDASTPEKLELRRKTKIGIISMVFGWVSFSLVVTSATN